MADERVTVKIVVSTPESRRLDALENLEAEVGHYLRRHEAPELRGPYIAAREAVPPW